MGRVRVKDLKCREVDASRLMVKLETQLEDEAVHGHIWSVFRVNPNKESPRTRF